MDLDLHERFVVAVTDQLTDCLVALDQAEEEANFLRAVRDAPCAFHGLIGDGHRMVYADHVADSIHGADQVADAA